MSTAEPTMEALEDLLLRHELIPSDELRQQIENMPWDLRETPLGKLLVLACISVPDLRAKEDVEVNEWYALYGRLCALPRMIDGAFAYYKAYYLIAIALMIAPDEHSVFSQCVDGERALHRLDIITTRRLLAGIEHLYTHYLFMNEGDQAEEIRRHYNEAMESAMHFHHLCSKAYRRGNEGLVRPAAEKVLQLVADGKKYFGLEYQHPDVTDELLEELHSVTNDS